MNIDMAIVPSINEFNLNNIPTESIIGVFNADPLLTCPSKGYPLHSYRQIKEIEMGLFITGLGKN
jgi:hypothetical protein